MHRTSQTGVPDPNKSAHMLHQCKQLDKPLIFGSTPPVPQIPYIRGLGVLAHTMRVDTPEQSIFPLKVTHRVPANHPTIHNALVVCCYTHLLNSSLNALPTANKCNL